MQKTEMFLFIRKIRLLNSQATPQVIFTGCLNMEVYKSPASLLKTSLKNGRKCEQEFLKTAESVMILTAAIIYAIEYT